MGKRSGRRRPPNRAATRRTAPRPSRGPDSPEDQALVQMLREALRVSPVHLAAVVCQITDLVGMGGPEAVLDGDGGSDGVPATTAPNLAQLVESFIGVDVAETTLALHVIAEFTEDAVLRARIRRELPRRRQPVPPVIAHIAAFEVLGCHLVTAPDADDENIILGLRWPDGTETAALVLVNHALGGVVKDAFLMHGSADETLGQVLTTSLAHGLVLDDISPADARARLTDASARWATYPGDLDTETWPGARAFLHRVLERLPEGGTGLGAPGAFRGRRLAPETDAALDLPPAPDSVALYTVTIQLVGTDPAVWRRVDLRSDLTMDAVHAVIQEVMGWESTHLHGFWPCGPDDVWSTARLASGTDASGPALPAVGPREDEVRLDQVLVHLGDVLTYVYDFGDSWTHALTLEASRPAREDDPPARCTHGELAGPPEDCGGVWGYAEIADALRSGRPLPEHLEEWGLEDYEPDDFSPDDANVGLAVIGLGDDRLRAQIEHAVSGAARSAGLLGQSRALADLMTRLPPPVSMQLVLLQVAAAESGGSEPPAADKAELLRPVAALLGEALGEGIPLTQAGWMRPAVVERVWHSFGLDLPWLSRSGREIDLAPVRMLRTALVEVGLLRKRHGHLLLTRVAQSAREDPEALWGHLASRLGDAGTDVERHVRALYLLHAAARPDEPRARHQEVARFMQAAGWYVPVPVDPREHPYYRATDSVRAVLGELRVEETGDPTLLNTSAALARTSLSRLSTL